MDKLFIGDIPSEYHFAIFNNNYIDLYNTDTLIGTLDFYRVYMYENYFTYEKRTQTYNTSYYTTYATSIEVTNDYMYRRDFPSILEMTLIFSLFFIFIFNIFTSFFKRGGIFGGLL